ncbi:MAG: hypothetical protein GJV46_15485 [Geobacter sp.]|nr:hypothetical protein [Geobacter sp.]
MKRIATLFTAVLISLMPVVMPVFADETSTTGPSGQQDQEKDECLLLARKCGNSAVSIQDKIEKLKEEIAKGRAVYTAEELSNLKQKLDEVSKTLDFLLEK